MRNRLFSVAALTLMGLVLAGCAHEEADQALYAQRALIGMPKQTLLSCAGVPSRQANADGGLEYFTYSSESLQPRPSLNGWGGGWGGPHRYGGWGGGMGWGGDDVVNRNCDATFTLKNGVVQQVVYGSATDSPSGRLGQCYAIVQNCLALIPSQTVPAAGTGSMPAR